MAKIPQWVIALLIFIPVWVIGAFLIDRLNQRGTKAPLVVGDISHPTAPPRPDSFLREVGVVPRPTNKYVPVPTDPVWERYKRLMDHKRPWQQRNFEIVRKAAAEYRNNTGQ